jgi:glucosamine--fructose-6-phosphate aminotransferase (isomerizing)
MSETPELRDGPPWAMEEMILAEPGLVRPLLDNPAAAEAAELIRGAQPLITTGCGTSEHAAMAGAALLPGARSRDAFEAWLDPQDGGALVVVSHSGETRQTLAAMRAARAKTVLITANQQATADVVVRTPLEDTSWCHTVGYVSPLLCFVAIAGHLGAPVPDVAGIVDAVIARRDELRAAAQTLAGCERLLAVGSGLDEINAREVALKIEEGLHVPTTPLGLEKVLHGHLPAADARTGVVLLRLDSRRREERDERARNVEAAVGELGMPVARIDGLPTEDTAAGTLVAGALAVQLLTLELVMAAGTNPDLIRREEEPYRLAAAAGKE